ncbi:MAG: HEAT repeat domain-containing protein [Planctomycetota bacterium]
MRKLSSILTVALFAGLVAPVAALPSGEATEQEAQAAQREDRGRTMLLHTRDGRILRVRARQVDAGFEVRQGRDWIALPANFVERAVNESDVLAEARELERALGRKPEPTRRVAYADWLAREGLYPEAVRELDRVFEASPDEPAALALLTRIEIPLVLPDATEDFDRFLAQAASGSPAGREIAVLDLERAAADGALGDLAAALSEALHEKTPKRRAFAALALRRLFPGRAVRALLGRSLLDASSDVRVEASRGLGAVDDPAVAVPALKALSHSHPKVRQYAAESLGAMGYPETVEPMISFLGSAQSSSSGGRAPHRHIFIGRQFAYVQDYDVEVAQFQAIADPVINVGMEGAALDVAVLGASTDRTVVSVRRSLVQLTGHEGRTNHSWERWWSENAETWRANLEREGGPVSGADGN